MNDLAAWLLEQIAADEAKARETWERPHWAACNTQGDYGSLGDECDCGLPARVLAECEAKRAIVEESRRWGVPRKIRPEYRGDLFVPEIGDESLIRQYHRISDDEDDDWPWDPGRIWKREDYEAEVLEPQEELIFLRLLAQPYADRPGFREEWRA